MGRYAIFNGLVYGGGTEVIPNPEGTPTEELHSIQIDEDIYEIVGGGGSSEGYSETLLYKYTSGTTIDGIKTLNDDITNYDLLLFRLVFNVPTYTDHIISVSALEQVGYISNPVATGPHVSIVSYASDYIRIVEGETKNKINIFEINGNEYIDEIYGIKLEGGSGSGGNASLDATILYDTPITSTGTYSLIDDYNNYDFIGFKAGNGSTETDIRLYAVKDIQDSMNDNLVITNNVTNSWFNFTINENELTIPGKTVSTIYSVIGYKIKGGGGSSNVEANPAGTPTDTLSTIGIDGTIYDIEGSSGGGSSFVMDKLYAGTSEVPSSGSTVSLSKSIDNYDFIMFDIGQNSEHTHQFFTPDSLYDSTNQCLLFATNGGYCDVYASTSTELTFGERNTFSARLLYSVYGLKFGSGGSGSQEFISYDTTITTTQYGWWTAEDKDGNVLDPDQYELIAVSPIVNNSSSWVGAWDGAFYVNSVDGTTYRYDVTFVNINDGGYIRTSRTWDIKVVYRDKNAAGGGGGSTVVPNPEEEPTDTLNTIEIDGVVYNIEGGSEGEGVEIYSEDEYIVGKWIDGKNVYQRTYTGLSVQTSGTSWTHISAIDTSTWNEVIDCEIYRTMNSKYAKIPLAEVSSNVSGINDLAISLVSSTFNSTITALTVRYTKTVETDAPAWGSSVTNNYANFIDTDNVIVPSTSWSGTMSYTATEDCYIVLENDAQNGHFKVTIDGVEVYDFGTSGQYVSIKQPFAVKKGQMFGATSNQSNILSYTVYGITYASGGSSSGSSKIEYSTEEKEIGTWIDGSKIYQKTFVLTNLSLSTSWVFNILGTTGINIIDFDGYYELQINGTTDIHKIKCNFYDTNNYYAKTLIDNDGEDLTAQVYTNAHSLIKGVITIQYTKTTT